MDKEFAISSCIGKEQFSDPQIAHRVVRKHKARRDKRGRDGSRQVYRCKVCGHWHIGRAPQ